MTAWPSVGQSSADLWTEFEPSPTETTSDTSTNRGALTLVPDSDDGSTNEPFEEPGPSPDSEPIGVPDAKPGSLPVSTPEGDTSVVLCKLCRKRPKSPENGRKNCVVCIAHAQALKLCQNCGAEKDALARNGHKGRLCLKCQALPKRERCPSGSPAYRRKRCRGCNGPKEAGHALSYCEACRKQRAARRPCERCKDRPVRRGKYMKLCVRCANQVKVHQREYGRNHWRRQRDKRLALEAQQKAPLFGRLTELLQEHQRHLEEQRTLLLGRLAELLRDLEEQAWRVEQEVTPTNHMKFRGAVDQHSFPALPAYPLGLKIDRLVAESRGSVYEVVPLFTNAKGKPMLDSLRKGVCARLHVSERAYSNWQKEKATVAFDIADDVLRYAGWNWFDVWDPAEYPEVEAIFESEELTVMAA